MSGDVQPRKRKDKKKKKDAADDLQGNFSSEEIMHSHKDVGTGGNMCTKIIFYTLLGALLVMIGIILLDQRGLTDLDSSGGDSQWAPIFQGWLEDPPSHDDHLKTSDKDHGGNINGEDLNDSSEDRLDDVLASGEKNDDQESDENEDKDENGDSEKGADESDTMGVALKFGVGVALVIVAHVVLVRKWNSDDDDIVPPQTPTAPSPRLSVEVPRIVETSAEQEDDVQNEPEKNISISPEFVIRRQTLLPEELAQSFENRKREDSASSGGTEEDIEDDGQEARTFKMNVLSAELPVREERSFKDEKPFKEDRMFKLESFEDLMKKYRQLTPEGSDLEYEDEEEEEDGAELDEEEVDDEEEEEDLEDEEEENYPEETLPGKPNITTSKKISDHESDSEDEEVEDDYDDEKQSKLKMENEPEDDESEEEEEEEEEDDEDDPELFKQEEKQKPPYSKYQQNISDEEDTDDRAAPTLSKLSKGPGGEKAQNYVNYEITNDDDWNLIDELDKAAAEDTNN